MYNNIRIAEVCFFKLLFVVKVGANGAARVEEPENKTNVMHKSIRNSIVFFSMFNYTLFVYVINKQILNISFRHSLFICTGAVEILWKHKQAVERKSSTSSDTVSLL